MDNQVKRAIDSNLSRMCVMDRDISVIMGNVREGKRAKKKLPAVFVLIAVLILAAVSALAATGFLTYAGTLLQKEQTQGAFQDWPAKDKIELVVQLVKSGYLTAGGEVTKLLSGEMEEGEAGRLAETIVTD